MAFGGWLSYLIEVYLLNIISSKIANSFKTIKKLKMKKRINYLDLMANKKEILVKSMKSKIMEMMK